MYCLHQFKRISLAILGLTMVLDGAHALAEETRGQAAVMTSGNGVAVSGTWDANGFHGIYSGPKGVGRVVQPSKQNRPPILKSRVGAGVAIGQSAIVAVDDPDDESEAVSVGTSVGAFAGIGGGGAVAISGPGGVAVRVPGAPVIVVGSGTPLWNDVRKPLHKRSYRYSMPGRPELTNPVIPQSGKLTPQGNPVGVLKGLMPGGSIVAPPPPSRHTSRDSDPPEE